MTCMYVAQCRFIVMTVVRGSWLLGDKRQTDKLTGSKHKGLIHVHVHRYIYIRAVYAPDPLRLHTV